MDATSFEELSLHFTEKLSGLSEAIAIQSCMESAEEDVQAESDQAMESLWQEVEELSDILALVKSKCVDQRKALSGVEAVKEKLLSLINGVQYTRSNIPPHLPTLPSAASSHGLLSADQPTQKAVPPTPVRSQDHSQNNCVALATAPSSQSKVIKNSSNASVNKQQRPPCPLIDYLTVDEFTDVPKYMKGRLSYQQVNAAVDELNKAFTTKYKLLKQKKSTMNDAHRKRCETLKMQESKDTRGVYFLVETDVKEWSSLKMSRETHNLLTVLRHCGRLCEIRGDGHVRYAMIERY